MYDEALNDADKCIEVKSDWVRGYSRKGNALEFLHKYAEAKAAYLEGMKIEPDNAQLKDALSKVEEQLSAGGSGSGAPAGSSGFSNPFADPNIMSRIASNPQLAGYLKQPDFVHMLQEVMKDPNKNLPLYMQDQRLMQTMACLLGLNIGMEGGDSDSPMDFSEEPVDDEPYKPYRPTPPPAEPAKPKVSPAQQQALDAKELGNAAYKKKEFETALEHYGRAMELDPENMTYLTNRAAVYLEQARYPECIEECERAVELGREHCADYKSIARALSRIGMAYMKLPDLTNAVKYFNKSLAEFRDPVVVKRVAEIEREIKMKAAADYEDPVKAEEAKQRGNQLFTKGNYPDAMKQYNEAILRAPRDAKLYSNRAFCYTKLMEFSMALKDADKCIQLDPTFVKGHLRKAAVHTALKENGKAAQSFKAALEIDPNCEEARVGMHKAMGQADHSERREAAMHDPEIRQIMEDPGMQMILGQMQRDPAALNEHLKDPAIRDKIMKLVDAGLLSIGRG